MYAGPASGPISHLLIRDDQGVVHRVEDFRSFDCGPAGRSQRRRCAERRGYAYHYDELAEYIEQHAGPGMTPVELIYRTWEVRAGAPPATAPDCVVARCTVNP
jgi:hypothetical protein